MLAYIDSSVILRMAFGEPNPLPEFPKITHGVSSVLIHVECLRTVDRYRLQNNESESDFLQRVELIYAILNRLELIPLSSIILNRASQPFPISLRTLDALHLATCLVYQEHSERERPSILFCSHDETLKKASKAMGLTVAG